MSYKESADCFGRLVKVTMRVFLDKGSILELAHQLNNCIIVWIYICSDNDGCSSFKVTVLQWWIEQAT